MISVNIYCPRHQSAQVYRNGQPPKGIPLHITPLHELTG
ncbi:IS1 family transposase [Dickeya poaceiphila]